MDYNIWVSGNCNLRCRYCYEGPYKPSLNMSLEKAEDVINFIKSDLKEVNNRTLDINFHGGEPFLNIEVIKYLIKEIKDLIKESNTLLTFSITTNATILNKEVLKIITKDIKMVTLSIDGTKKTHDYMRPFADGKGSYDTVIKNSLKILDAKPDVRVRMTFDSDTVYSLAEDVIHLIDLGFKTIVPAPNFFDKRWDACHLSVLEKQIKTIKSYINDKKDVLVSLCTPKDYCRISKCNGGVKSRVIYVDGTIYPCIVAGGEKEFQIGNIYFGINKDKLSKLMKYSGKVNPCCDGCSISSSCSGNRCKIINKIITDDFFNPPAIECESENLLYSINNIR